MTRFIILINTYKDKIAALQKSQKYYNSTGRCGACISIQGEIQAYNAVIKDLQKLTEPGYKF